MDGPASLPEAEELSPFRLLAPERPFSPVIFTSAHSGRVYSAAGNFEGALKEVKAAQAVPGNPDGQVKALDPLIRRLENKEDINR